jgi:predicted esterase
MQQMSKRFPNVKYILPTAAERPISLNGGYKMTGWFDIKSLDKSAAEDVDGVKQSAEYIRRFIADEEAAGIPAERVFLGGFSQGAAMSIFTGLSYPKRLGGIMAMSGWATCHDALKEVLSEANKGTPLIMLHGEADQVVQHAWGKMSHTGLVGHRGAENTEFKSYRGMGHSSSNEEIEDLFTWFAKHTSQ